MDKIQSIKGTHDILPNESEKMERSRRYYL